MKTAIEQLIEDLDTFLFDFTIEKKHEKSIKDIWNKAKELEKQQIIDAHGDKLKQSAGTSNYEYWFTGEDYYNKTFKK